MEREQTTIRLPKDLKEEIQRQADEEGQSNTTDNKQFMLDGSVLFDGTKLIT